jgi:hypothetical protein
MVDIPMDWQMHDFSLDDEIVTIELKPLATSSVFKLMQVDLTTPDEKQLEILRDIFSQSVGKIENLTISEKPAVADDLVNVSQLMTLCSEVVIRLTEISNLKKADEKNSNRQSTSAQQKEALAS